MWLHLRLESPDRLHSHTHFNITSAPLITGEHPTRALPAPITAFTVTLQGFLSYSLSQHTLISVNVLYLVCLSFQEFPSMM
jgi:hypothetical protein